jgi:Arginase family
MSQSNLQLSSWGVPVLLGIPLDHNSSFLRGPAQAPPRIRAAFHSDAWNSWPGGRIDLAQLGIFEDAGDLSKMEEPDAFERIEEAVAKIVDGKKRALCLGGDHSITYPILRALGKRVPGITLVHFDAHPDLYADYEGNPRSHASPFARIMENQLVQRLVQIGIRTLNDHQRAQAKKYGVEIHEMESLPKLAKLNLGWPDLRFLRYGRARSGLCAGRLSLGTRRPVHSRGHWLFAGPSSSYRRRGHRRIESCSRYFRPDPDGSRKIAEGTSRKDDPRIVEAPRSWKDCGQVLSSLRKDSARCHFSRSPFPFSLSSPSMLQLLPVQSERACSAAEPLLPT